MADFPVRIAGSFATALTTFYTVPAGKKLLVRNIHIANRAATSIYLEIGTQIWLWSVALAANSAYDWSGFAVVDAGQTIAGSSPGAAESRIVISGVEVDA